MHSSLIALLFVFFSASAQYQQWPPVVRPQQRQQPSSHSLNGNAGIYGGGSGDVYMGRLGDGLYGAGTRFGGIVGIGGTVGYAGGQGTRGKRALVITELRGSTMGETSHTEDMYRASGVVKGEAKISLGENSKEEEESTTTSTQTTTTETSKQEEERTKRPLKAVCAPRRLRAGRR